MLEEESSDCVLARTFHFPYGYRTPSGDRLRPIASPLFASPAYIVALDLTQNLSGSRIATRH